MPSHFLGSRASAWKWLLGKANTVKLNATPSYSFSYLWYLSWCHTVWNVPLVNLCQLSCLCPLQDFVHLLPLGCWRDRAAAGPALLSCTKTLLGSQQGTAQLCEGCWGKWAPAHTHPTAQSNNILHSFQIVLFKCIPLLWMYTFDVFDRKMEMECEQGKTTKEECPRKISVSPY